MVPLLYDIGRGADPLYVEYFGKLLRHLLCDDRGRQGRLPDLGQGRDMAPC